MRGTQLSVSSSIICKVDGEPNCTIITLIQLESLDLDCQTHIPVLNLEEYKVEL